MNSSLNHDTAIAQLTEVVLQMQSRTEALYLSQKAMEQDMQLLRATQPVAMCRPVPPGLPLRILMRFHKGLRRRYHARLIRLSGFFDPDWYLKAYEDVRSGGSDPLEHFIQNGNTERRNPGPYFDTDHYLHLYPDIAANGMNPLLHYVISGWEEKRSIRPGMPHGGLT
tara:strand:- start:7184 stop:7687 length:504 start_codon:yes stop_codon:yes gene_type:complete